MAEGWLNRVEGVGQGGLLDLALALVTLRHIASGLAHWPSLNDTDIDTDIGTAADIHTDTAADIGPVKLHIGRF